MYFAIDFFVLLMEISSISFPIWKKRIAPTASVYFPMISAPTVARSIRKFSSKKCIFLKFRISCAKTPAANAK